MKWDTPTITAVISAVVAISGTIFAYVGRRKESVDSSTDKRIELILGANATLVDDLRAERESMREEAEQLRSRVDTLETDRDSLRREVGRLRDMVKEQSDELYTLRIREAELRAWSLDIMKWVAVAIELIRELGGSIDGPPVPPPPSTKP